jgi:hypothetical protein
MILVPFMIGLVQLLMVLAPIKKNSLHCGANLAKPCVPKGLAEVKIKEEGENENKQIS